LTYVIIVPVKNVLVSAFAGAAVERSLILATRIGGTLSLVRTRYFAYLHFINTEKRPSIVFRASMIGQKAAFV
jgi:hypothetical protein